MVSIKFVHYSGLILFLHPTLQIPTGFVNQALPGVPFENEYSRDTAQDC